MFERRRRYVLERGDGLGGVNVGILKIHGLVVGLKVLFEVEC